MACNEILTPSENLAQFLTEIRETYRLLEQINLAREILELTFCTSRAHCFEPDPEAQKIIAEMETLLLHDCVSPITYEQAKHYKATTKSICDKNINKKQEEQKLLIQDVMYGYVGNWYDNAF